MSKSFQPDWISPPGNTIVDILGEREIPIGLFAKRMNITTSQANNLINGVSVITQDIAEQLAMCLGASRDFWIKRELQYRDSVVNSEKRERDKWVSNLPIKDLIRFGWISTDGDRYAECLHFFGATDIKSWEQRYKKELNSVAFRTSSSFENEPASVATWIRMGEIQTEQIQCASWDAEAFRKSLVTIRTLTRQKDPKIFIPKLIEICAACGVAVAVVKTPMGCSASGATKFISNNRALLLLSFRYLSDDHFWFTFFHEAGHLLLHGKESLFIEEKQKDVWDKREKEADDFSSEILVPSEYKNELLRVPLNKWSIVKLSVKIGVSPGIIIGQMQFAKRIDFARYNAYKRRYKWEE